jgi:hypothetical protein
MLYVADTGNHRITQGLLLLPEPPTITSPTSTAITATGATLGGNVTDDGRDTVIERGVVISETSENAAPELGGVRVTKKTVSGTTGQFTEPVTALSPETAYTFRAYATNSLGTSYTTAREFATVAWILGGKDLATSASGSTRIFPLANDSLPSSQPLALVSVSNPLIEIEGRSLVIPAGFTGAFTYTFSDGTTTGQGTVTVETGAPSLNPRGLFGLLRDAQGKVVGAASALPGRGGIATFSMAVGRGRVQTRIALRPDGSRLTALGEVQLVSAAGAYDVILKAPAGDLTGQLLPYRRITASAALYHVALPSLDPTITGGGFSRITLSRYGWARIVGATPDGKLFLAGAHVRENNTLAFYAPTGRTVKSSSVAGELVLADLPESDVLGELRWHKPPQGRGAREPEAGGVDTVLQAFGSIYKAPLVLAGPAELQVGGGNLPAVQTNQVTVLAGKPTMPAGVVKSWTIDRLRGVFRVTILVPGATRAIAGSGLYLPKSRQAWGYFPGATHGGYIELSLAALP